MAHKSHRRKLKLSSITDNNLFGKQYLAKYSKRPRILRIKQYFKKPTEFSFLPIGKDVIAKEIKNLDTKMATPQDDIPVKILKLNNDIFSQYLSQIFNESIEAANFPNKSKYADITSV